MRGRRFFRPTLTYSQKGGEVRALADLEHKPWAAEDGEVWMAAFNVDEGLDGAREIELSVAPDIAVELRRKGRKLARPGDTLSAGGIARAPRFKDESIVAVPRDDEKTPASGSEPGPQTSPPPPPRRRPDPSVELERLGARLAAASRELEQERERRGALAKSLEDERSTNRQLRTELGQARSELEVAATARAEANAVEAELEDTRRQLREAQRRHEADTEALARRHEEATQALTRDHEQVTDAHSALQDELQRQTGVLEATREALAAERAEAGRLRNRLAQIQEDRQRGITPAGARTTRGSASGAAAASGAAQAAPAAETAGVAEGSAGREVAGSAGSAGAESRASRRRASRAAARHPEPDPTETQRFDVLRLQDEPATEAAPSRRSRRRSRHQTPEPPAWTPPVADRLRPLNPSLRHRTWWFGRLLALLVLCGVIAAVWVVLHSTVLH